MELLKLVGIAISACCAAVVVKAYRPELGMQISIAFALIVLIIALDDVSDLFKGMHRISQDYNVDIIYIKTMLKVIGIAYIVQFASDICKDSNESAIANKVEFAGRLMILSLCIPIINEVLGVISLLLESV